MAQVSPVKAPSGLKLTGKTQHAARALRPTGEGTLVGSMRQRRRGQGGKQAGKETGKQLPHEVAGASAVAVE